MDSKRDRKSFGNWLRSQREKTGLSQDKVSRQLGYTVKTRITRIENGYDPIPLRKLFELADIYGIGIDEIIGKLREYDPEKASEFDELSEKFALYHLRSMQKASRRFMDSQAPAHHIPFPLIGLIDDPGKRQGISLKRPLHNHSLDILNCGTSTNGRAFRQSSKCQYYILSEVSNKNHFLLFFKPFA